MKNREATIALFSRSSRKICRSLCIFQNLAKANSALFIWQSSKLIKLCLHWNMSLEGMWNNSHFKSTSSRKKQYWKKWIIHLCFNFTEVSRI